MEKDQFSYLLEKSSSTSESDNVDSETLSPVKRSKFFYPMLASWSGAMNLTGLATTNVIWPAQVSAILQDPIKDDLFNGIVPTPGAIVSIFMCPIAGVISDYVQLRFGRRKIFILMGTILAVTALAFMPLFHKGGSPNDIYILMGLIICYSTGISSGIAPHTALVYDLVEKDNIGAASGWYGAAAAVGSIVGTVGSGFLVDFGGESNFWPAYIFTMVTFIALSLPTILGIKEPPLPRINEHPTKHLIKTFWLPPALYKDFYWVILTRACFFVGVCAFTPYLQYFFEDVIKSKNPATMSSIALGALIVSSIPSTLLAGYFSDKYGRKGMVYTSSAIMSVGTGFISLLAYYPNMIAMYCLAVVLGLGYGVYMAVDSALAMDVLPPNSSVARDMGYWSLTALVPAAVAPAISGAVLAAVKKSYGVSPAYMALSVMVSSWFLLATVFVYFVRVPDHKKRHILIEEISLSETKQ